MGTPSKISFNYNCFFFFWVGCVCVCVGGERGGSGFSRE